MSHCGILVGLLCLNQTRVQANISITITDNSSVDLYEKHHSWSEVQGVLS